MTRSNFRCHWDIKALINDQAAFFRKCRDLKDKEYPHLWNLDDAEIWEAAKNKNDQTAYQWSWDFFLSEIKELMGQRNRWKVKLKNINGINEEELCIQADSPQELINKILPEIQGPLLLYKEGSGFKIKYENEKTPFLDSWCEIQAKRGRKPAM